MQESEVITSSSSKKVVLDDLSKEELIKRCKNLLVIAQKSKHAKDEIQLREIELQQKIEVLEKRILDHDKARFTNEQEDEQDLENLKLQLKDKDDEIHNLKEKIDLLSVELRTVTDVHEKQKDGFVEELNEMNTVLKQRGEAITKLEEKFKDTTNELKKEVENLTQSLTEKERRIEQLESEVNRNDAQSEVMSTSTVSRAEEIHRMKDVEDSLEDRYNKLKMLAVKMKKKLSEQNIEIQEKEAKFAALSKEKGKSLPMPINIQALQKDIDRLNDEVDLKKSELTTLKKDFEACVQELAKSKQTAEEYKNEVSIVKTASSNLEKVKTHLDNMLQELKSQNELIGQEKETEKIMRQELSKECEQLRKDIVNLNTVINDLRRKNEEQCQEFKRQNHLQLEISDYELSVRELHSKIDTLTQELQTKDTMIVKNTEALESQRNHVQFLETQLKMEEEKANGFLIKSEDCQSQLNSLLEEQKKKEMQLCRLLDEEHSKANELERLRSDLSLVNSELKTAQHSHSLQLESLRKQVAMLENHLTSEQKNKEDALARLTTVQEEYESYKVRAASVLKKKKVEGLQNDTAAKDDAPSNDFSLNTDKVERDMLQRLVDALKLKITELELQLNLSVNEMSNLRAEKERSIAIEAKINQTLEQRLARATEEMESIQQEHHNTVQRLQSDNQLLASLHREQVENLKMRHVEEVNVLQEQLDVASSEIARMQIIATSNGSHRSISPQVKAAEAARDEFDYESRELAADSELSHNHSHISLMPGAEKDSMKPMSLEELLNSSNLTEESVEISATVTSETSSQRLNELLSVSDKRCRHLSALLAESEANEARLSQLTEALKEEIRRSERSEERQKHVENLEYLKNVILKFVTLPRGEERARLVPVLSTLLRLSPLEIQDLVRVFDSPVRPTTWGGVFNLWAPSQ